MDDAGQQSTGNAAECLATDFLKQFRESGTYLRDNVTRLATFATSENEEAAKAATGAIFTSLVEKLADSFEPASVTLYNRLFAQLIQFCRKVERGREIDRELTSFGLQTEGDLIARAERLRRVPSIKISRDQHQNLKRIIALSRVTLGADIATTSVIIERLKREFPNADIVLIGGRKSAELFGGDSRLRFRETDYRRAGSTIERLLSWIDVLKCVRASTVDLESGECLIVDPDTRLTQLGLLPLTVPGAASKGIMGGGYLFFPSREYGSQTSQSLGQLASEWLNEVFGAEAVTLPKLSLSRSDAEAAVALIKNLKGAGPVVSINLGVGENPMKRIGDYFERTLVSRLIEGGATIILDRGAGEDEMRRADAIISEVNRISRNGRAPEVIEANEASLNELIRRDRLNTRMVVWGGRIGLLAALIGKSDLYIGYDSAGQHIAAALGVPCIDVFAGFSSPRMLDRWRPAGKSEVRVIAVDTLAGGVDQRAVLSDVMRHARDMLKNICP